jgi:hypothetical protein
MTWDFGAITVPRWVMGSGVTRQADNYQCRIARLLDSLQAEEL